MPIESTVNSVADLNELWPTVDDKIHEADDHLRNIKKAVKASFTGTGTFNNITNTGRANLNNVYVTNGLNVAGVSNFDTTINAKNNVVAFTEPTVVIGQEVYGGILHSSMVVNGTSVARGRLYVQNKWGDNEVETIISSSNESIPQNASFSFGSSGTFTTAKTRSNDYISDSAHGAGGYDSFYINSPYKMKGITASSGTSLYTPIVAGNQRTNGFGWDGGCGFGMLTLGDGHFPFPTIVAATHDLDATGLGTSTSVWTFRHIADPANPGIVEGSITNNVGYIPGNTNVLINNLQTQLSTLQQRFNDYVTAHP